jgi:hypothetical protein
MCSSPHARSIRSVPARRQGLKWTVYTIVAFLVTLVWTNWAETERAIPTHSSIQALVAGTTEPPFVKRRLVPDTAWLLSSAVPAPVWRMVTSAIDAVPPVAQRMRVSWGWKDEARPLLISATFLIFVSILAYTFAADRLITEHFRLTPSQVMWLSAAFAVLLLGGGGGRTNVRTYNWYSYDAPMACLVAWLLIGMAGRRWWTVIVFALAAYCKETAIFQIVVAMVYAYVGPDRRRRLVDVAVFATLFVLIQGYFALRYQAPPLQDSFNYLSENALFLLWQLVFASWKAVVLALIVLRVAAVWPTMPRDFKIAAVLLPCFLVGAMSKGRITEYRLYTELVLPVGLILLWSARTDVSRLAAAAAEWSGGRKLAPGKMPP